MNIQGDMDEPQQTFDSFEQYDFETPIMHTQEKSNFSHSDTLTDVLDQPGLKNGCNKTTYAPKNIVKAMFRRNTLAIKQAEASKDEGTKLKRVLQWYHLMGYGFASTVGAGSLFLCFHHLVFLFISSTILGIFVVAGQVANQYAGPGIIFSFLIAAFSSLLSAFCYSEYAVRVPLSGSAYTFSYVTLGEVIGWLYVEFSLKSLCILIVV